VPFVDGLIGNHAAIVRKRLDSEKVRRLYSDRIAGCDLCHWTGIRPEPAVGSFRLIIDDPFDLAQGRSGHILAALQGYFSGARNYLPIN